MPRAVISTLAGEFKSYIELKESYDKLFVELQQAKNKIVELQQVAKVDIIPKTDEELICETQIALLHNSSQQRALDLEEAKMLDILVRTLNSARRKAKPIEVNKPEIVYDEATLLQIASIPKEKVEE